MPNKGSNANNTATATPVITPCNTADIETSVLTFSKGKNSPKTIGSNFCNKLPNTAPNIAPNKPITAICIRYIKNASRPLAPKVRNTATVDSLLLI